METYVEILPSQSLRKIIDCYWFMGGPLRYGAPHRRVIPDNRVDILFAREGEKQDIFFSGPMSKSFLATSREIVGIRFRPEYVQGMFGLPLGEFVDSAIPLDLILKDFGTLKAIFENESKDKIIELFDSYFMAQIPKLSVGWDQRVIYFARGLENGKSLYEMKNSLSLSEQHLRRLFKKFIGISPKRYEKISRFLRVKQAIAVSREKDWADLAIMSNYFDQSHFVNDCKELTDLTPSQYFV